MKKVQTMGAPVALVVLTGVLLLAGCRDILTDPAPAGPASLALSMVMPEGTSAQSTQSETGPAMSPGAAFDQADQIRIQLRGEAGTRVDVERGFQPQGPETRVRVEVDLDEEEVVAITLALLRQNAPLFEAEGTVTLEPGESSSLVLELRGVVASVEVETGPVEFDALGDRQALSARGVFATGQTVPGATPSWTSRNPSVARIVGGTQVEAVAEGETEVVARVGAREASAAVRIRQRVEQVRPSPSTLEVVVGQSRMMSVALEDRNGNRISASGRTVAWTSSNGGVATVNGAGQVTGVSEGTAIITATVDGVSGQGTVTVTDPQPPTITTRSLPDGTVGESYSATLEAEGGDTPYTWSLASGTLPAGLSLSTAGVISGTPTTAQSRTFTVRVTGANGLSDTRQYTVQVQSAPEPPTITTASLPGGTVGESYSATLQASGGETPYTWAVAGGSLPAGLSLSTAGVISGTPTTAQSRTFTVRVTGANDLSSTRVLAIEVTTEPMPELSVAVTGQGRVVSTPSGIFVQGDGNSDSAEFPRGTRVTLSADPADGWEFARWQGACRLISSTSVCELALNQDRETRAIFEEVVGVRVVTTSLAIGQVGVQYSETLRAVGGSPPYSWVILNGRLPDGLRLDGERIVGTPTRTGTFTFTIQATDLRGERDSVELSIVVGQDVDFQDFTLSRCGQWSSPRSGSVGVTQDTWDISAIPSSARVSIRFNAFGIPDRFVVEYPVGVLVWDSGWRGDTSYDGNPLYPGGIAGPGSGSQSNLFQKSPGQNQFRVTVTGVESGTAWNYEMRCDL